VILVDSSVWIDFFRCGNSQLSDRIEREEIATHPFVLIELALGSLKHRKQTLLELDELDTVTTAENFEVRRMIEDSRLYSRGIGFVDAHLIASCLLTSGTQLWTRDGRLASAARTAGVQVLQLTIEN
jgi:predicted nucleic acid-binding protein